MNISFHLRMEKKSVKTGLIPIAILVTEKGISVRKNIPNIKVLENDWNRDSQRIIPNKKGEPKNNHFEFNSILNSIVFRLNEYWTKAFLSGKPITQELIIQTIENKSPIEIEAMDFIQCFEEFIHQNTSIKAERTIKGYTTTKNLFDNFFKESGISRSFDAIDLKFFDEFRNYCFDDQRCYLNNYFAKLIAHLKTFMRWAYEREYHNNLIFNKFTAPEEDIEVIFLTPEELGILYHFEFESEKLDRVRDLYCMACFTGLRTSDLSKLKASHIYKDVIKTDFRKTKQLDMIIPLNEYSLAILKKYEDTIYNPLPIISTQKMNDYIKEACEIAGIDTQITIIRYSGSKKIEQVVPKWKRITTHTGRKSFISNSIMFNMDITAIKSVTGHKTDRSFQKYVKVTDDFKRAEAQKWNSMIVKKKTN